MYLQGSDNLSKYGGLEGVWGFGAEAAPEAPAVTQETIVEKVTTPEVTTTVQETVKEVAVKEESSSSWPLIIGVGAIALFLGWGYAGVKSFDEATKS